MGILDFVSKQFIDVIDWTEEPGLLAWRYPMQDREIQNGGKLTVREGQVAAFLNEGKLADTFEPGLYTLNTHTLPVLTNLRNWDKAFQSPFKSDVYFFTRREQLNLKWGTTQPVTVRDKDLGPIRVRAFGSYSFHIKDVAPFREHIVGILDAVMVDDIEPQLRAAITTAVATGLGSQSAFLDLAANQAALSDTLKGAVTASLAQWGLELGSFFVESLSLPQEVQEHLDKASSMRAVGDLNQYAKFQAAEALETAAAQPGGLAGLGAGAVAGVAIGQTMMGALATPSGGAAVGGEDPFQVIEKLHKLLTIGAITQEEFDAKKASLLTRIG